jgi:hypothetical protein
MLGDPVEWLNRHRSCKCVGIYIRLLVNQVLEVELNGI